MVLYDILIEKGIIYARLEIDNRSIQHLKQIIALAYSDRFYLLGFQSYFSVWESFTQNHGPISNPFSF